MINKINNRGETIVEVLISTAIIGIVIAATYSLAINSINVIRNAQEREDATAAAKSQIELITGLGPNPLTQTSTNFCLDTTGKIISGTCSNYRSDIYNENFNVNVSYLSSPSINIYGFLYKISVNWVGVSSKNNNVTMYYIARKS